MTSEFRLRILVLVLVLTFITVLAGCGASSANNTPPPPPAPTVTLAVNPSTITAGGTGATLTWTSTNATSVTISPSVGSGTLAANGNVNVNPTQTTTYEITASGPGGSTKASATLTVNAPAAPTVSISVSPRTITAGNTANLIWSSTNATSVTITPSVSAAPLNLSDTTTVNPTTTTTYQIVATGPGGTAQASTTLIVNPPVPPQLTFTADNPAIAAGNPVTLTWNAQNATSIAITAAAGSNPPVQVTTSTNTQGTYTDKPTVTTTYTCTATGPGGQTSQSLTISVNQQPSITSFTATPTTINAGQISNLAWQTQNAVSVAISPAVGDGEGQPLPLSTNNFPVTPSQTTTYTLTATGAPGTTAVSKTVTVNVTTMTLTFTASPATITPGQPITLSWTTTGGVTSLTIDNGVGDQSSKLPNGSWTGQGPSATTTYTATATGPGGTITQTAQVVVSTVTNGNPLKHIIFMLQENRSFDDYFGMLPAYRAQRLQQFGISASPSDVDGYTCMDSSCTTVQVLQNGKPITVALHNRNGQMISPYHYQTSCTDNLSPSWDESHYDVHLPGTFPGNWKPTAQPNYTFDPTKFKMDNFLMTVSSIKPYPSTYDPNDSRPIGYYTNADLPFYYDLASFFATSDRWFSPMLGNTIPNRMYILAATSFGHAFPDPAPAGGFSAPTLFGALAKAKVSWRYYYLDNSVFLSQFADYANNPAVQSNVRPISEYYSILSGNCGGTACDPDKALPQVIFIERASNSGLDEHPDTGNNNQKGAAVVQQIITALMASPAWKDSAFIFTFDEAGGLYDHVAPFQVPLPDQYAPGQCPDAGSPCTFSSGDAPATFNLSGLRLPMIVISPYAKPHFVSHVNRDSTAILAFIEKMFNVPALTNRDAYFQDPSRDMSEFFDLTTPAMLNAPDGQPWVNSDGTLHVLTPQNTNLKCDSRLEAAPPSAVH